jgi:hypothetical protein
MAIMFHAHYCIYPKWLLGLTLPRVQIKHHH